MATRPGHLRPRSLSDILDGAVRHYRARFQALLLPFLPMAVIQVLGILMMAGFFGFLLSLGEDLPDNLDTTTLVQWILFSFVFGILMFLAYVPGFGAAVLMTGTDLLGRTLSPGDAWRQASGKFWGLLGVGLLWSSAHFLAAVAAMLVLGVSALGGPLVLIALPVAMIPNLFVWVMFSLCAHAYLLEGIGALESFGRSRDLVRDNFWRGAGILVFVVVINVALGTVSSVPQYVAPLFLDAEGDPTTAFYAIFGISSVVGLLMNLVLMPLYTLLYTHFYWDIRVRKEGLDLDAKLRRVAPAAL